MNFAAANPAFARRDFLKTAGLLSLGAAINAGAQTNSPVSTTNLPPASVPGTMPMRKFGRADTQISALGCGGHHLGDLKSVDHAIRLVQEAVDGGITFFDNCWEYWNGKTENILGRGLEGRRDKVFLMTKVCTHGRSAKLAMQMLEESLRRLRTDHLDLWQIHGVVYDNDPDLAYATGGVLEALDQAKQQGKTRFVGFTGHKDPAIHLRMIQMGYAFDAVQMPLNPFDANFFSFEKVVLPEAIKRGIAVLGMKPMNGTAEAVKKGVFKAEEMLRYAMSLPVATTISGMDSLELLHKNLHAAHHFTPMTETEMEDFRRRCADPAADGRFEPYKVSLKFDNPMTRMPHGFPIDKEQKEVKDMFKKGNGGWEPIGM
ncbi:MAG TPA: aldo/keto reductase [Verrucomicrobiae bacterium]|jgi:predicted aldo/keto reductase-like oxidoreductase|nr:aldo/keto reductase [Verrucomicrobiae bacterium]